MRQPKPKLKPFGTPRAQVKYGSTRYNASELPPVTMRELVLLTPEGKTRIFSMVYGIDEIETALQTTLDMSLEEIMLAGYVVVNNSTVRLPTIMLATGYDMTVRQLKPFREVLTRYKPNLAFFLVRTYNDGDKSFTDLGQFRTLYGAEMAARGG